MKRVALGFTAAWLLFGCAHLPHTARPPSAISVAEVPGYSGAGFEWSTQRSARGTPEVLASESPPQGLRIRWLGTAGFELSDDSTTLLIDPFVSRPSMLKVLLLSNLEIDTEAVDFYALSGVNLSNVRAILTSHAHHDHVMDVPYILAKYKEAGKRPLVIGTDDIPRLLSAYDGREDAVPWLRGVEPLSKTPVRVFDSAVLDQKPKPEQFGEFKVTPFLSNHGFYDDYPMIELGHALNGKAPLNGLNYGANHHATVAYLIEYRGLRLFFCESPTSRIPEALFNQIGRVDVVFKGIASRMHEGRIFYTIQKLSPTYFVPTHFDNFFKSFHDIDRLGYKIPMPVDQVKYEAFLEQFHEFKKRAPAAASARTQLRLMRPLFYYSLAGLTK